MEQWSLAGETACPTERRSALSMAGNVETPDCGKPLTKSHSLGSLRTARGRPIGNRPPVDYQLAAGCQPGCQPVVMALRATEGDENQRGSEIGKAGQGASRGPGGPPYFCRFSTVRRNGMNCCTEKKK